MQIKVTGDMLTKQETGMPKSADIVAKGILNSFKGGMEAILDTEETKEFISQMESIAAECGMNPEQFGSYASCCVGGKDTGIIENLVRAYLTAIKDMVEQYCLSAGLQQDDVKVSTYYGGLEGSMVNVELSTLHPREITSGEELKAAVDDALKQERQYAGKE